MMSHVCYMSNFEVYKLLGERRPWWTTLLYDDPQVQNAVGVPPDSTAVFTSRQFMSSYSWGLWNPLTGDRCFAQTFPLYRWGRSLRFVPTILQTLTMLCDLVLFFNESEPCQQINNHTFPRTGSMSVSKLRLRKVWICLQNLIVTVCQNMMMIHLSIYLLLTAA